MTSHAVWRFVRRRNLIARVTRDQRRYLARESYQSGWMLSREEAAARIRGPVYPGNGDFFFRADGTSKGVWVVCLRQGSEVVVTYLPARPRRVLLKPGRWNMRGAAGVARGKPRPFAEDVGPALEQVAATEEPTRLEGPLAGDPTL